MAAGITPQFPPAEHKPEWQREWEKPTATGTGALSLTCLTPFSPVIAIAPLSQSLLAVSVLSVAVAVAL